ncbi:MAG TPA: hypothetical protein VF066_15940 [Thermoleophilaceae bacterium]
MQRNHDRAPSPDRMRGPVARTTIALAAAATLALTAASGASAVMHGAPDIGKQSAPTHKQHGHQARGQRPIRALVLTPTAGDRTGSGFSVDVSLQARNAKGNRRLSGYTSLFNDPTGPDGQPNPAFHPGASSAAPGLVVTLSTTPAVDGTPLVGPRTNLAGVFQLNSVTRLRGLTQTWNDWQVTSPGFFGKNTSSTLTVYAVRGKAPDAVPAGGLKPISNVVRQTFRIGS